MVFGFVPSKITGNEKTLTSDSFSTLNIPNEYSYQNLMSPIINQGSSSTCVPCSISAVYDYYNAVKKPNTQHNNKFSSTHISIDQIYDARTNSEEGMSFKEALTFCKNTGVVTAEEYKSNNLSKAVKIKDFAKIGSSIVMKYSLIINGPGLIAMLVKDDYKTDFWNGSGNYGGHAVSVVGYNDSKSSFIIRNSWGTSYGTNGYALLPYDDFNKRVIEAWAIIM